MPDPLARRQKLIDMLFRIEYMRHPDGASDLLDEMRKHRCTLNIRTVAYPRVNFVHIIDATMARRDGLFCLANSLRVLDGSELADDFLEYVREWYSNEFLAPTERDELVSELAPHVTPQKLITYYHIATGEFPDNKFSDFDDLLREIEQRTWPGPGHPLVKLTAAIAREAESSLLAERAIKWSSVLADRIDEATGRSGAEREILNNIWSGEVELSVDTLAPPTLIFQLDPVTPRPNHYRLTSWLFFANIRGEKVYQSEDADPLTLPRVGDSLAHVFGEAMRFAR